MKNLYKIFVLLFAIGLFVVACDDVKLDEPQVDEELAVENTDALAAVADVFAATVTNQGGGKSATDCPNVVYEVGTRTLTLTYPTEGCTGLDGVSRAGVITSVFDATFGEPGGKVTITFNNFSRKGSMLEGTMTVELTGYDEMQNPMYTVKSDGNMTLTYADNKKLTWSFSTYFTWIDGWDTPLVKADDIWKMSGTSTGTARSGKTFTRTDTDLTTSPTCPWFVSGKIELTINESDDLTMEFTSCGSVTFTYRGITITRTL